MFTRRAAIAATVLLALFGAACGNNGGARVAATADEPADNSSSSTAITAAVVTTTVPVETTTTAPAATITAPPAASENPTPPPAPATLTVKYQPHDGGTASATLEETGASLPLDDGSAVFTNLPDGTYTVDVTVVYPNDGGVGGQNINRSRPIAVAAGDHAVVTCDDSECIGIA
jgi:hypothetical protein